MRLKLVLTKISKDSKRLIPHALGNLAIMTKNFLDNGQNSIFPYEIKVMI